MKESSYKSYDELPLFLSTKKGSRRSPAERVRWEEEAQRNGLFFALGGNEGYGACADEMHEPDFSVLRIGNRMVVPKERFIQWVKEHTGGGAA